ncbi:lon protease homolog 2, peroxisomal-like [Wolffia australiana]
MDEIGELPLRLGILPFRNKVLLPGAIARIECDTEACVNLIEGELWQREENAVIGVVPVRDESYAMARENGSDDPNLNVPEDVFDLIKRDDEWVGEPILWHNRGVAAKVLHVSREVEKLNGQVSYAMVIEGLCRIMVHKITSSGGYILADVSHLGAARLPDVADLSQDPDIILLSLQFKAIALQLISVLEKSGMRTSQSRYLLENIPVHRLVDIFVASFEIRFEEQLNVLDCVDPKSRIIKAIEIVGRHLKLIRTTENMTQRVEKQLLTLRKEFLLPQQMRAVNGKLIDIKDEEDDVTVVKRNIFCAGMPRRVMKYALKELRKLIKMQPHQPGYFTSQNYLGLLTDLPWGKATKESDIDLEAAKDHLDSKHYGMTKVKQRIIEYLAVRKLKPDARGPVLCFVGAPGIGKTSLASSIASALNRKFVRIALGGVKDEADIRGHRRTYIGSMPGRLIEGLRRAGVHNPVILLDEVDKVGSQNNGDPSSALLEALDPQQNYAFTDHYLDVPFDLSKVIFIATANKSQQIPSPLLDRMEVIELEGYTATEKLKIALHHLIPGVLERHGLGSDTLRMPEEVVRFIIEHYTKEAGVRNLERCLAAIARHVAVRVVETDSNARLCNNLLMMSSSTVHSQCECGAELEMEGISTNDKLIKLDAMNINNSATVIDTEMIEKILGPPIFNTGITLEGVATPGVCLGLVWTSLGSDIQHIEAATMPGKGDLLLTGQLGDVVKESVQIALTWIRARRTDPTSRGDAHFLDGQDIHVHFPAGSVPKDGPSSGITIATSLVSLFSKKCVRMDTAMTGELSLRGLLLPVGGIKDKVLAAHRYGIRRVIIPKRNLKDIVEVPPSVLKDMEIIFASRMEDVLEHAFEGGSPWKQQARL